MNTAEHVWPDLLEAYERAVLPPAVMREVESHLQECDSCNRLLEGLIDPEMVRKLRSALKGSPDSPPTLTPDAQATPAGIGATPQNTPAGQVGPGEQALLSLLADQDRYDVEALIGGGGMGVVFRATHRLMNRPVALKAVKASLNADPDMRQRFLREVRATAQLSHANVAAAYDAEQIGPVCVLVLEYVEGEDLGRLVQRQGPLPVRQACELASQAARGLQHAHEKGMVHRDVKPHNMRVTPDGTLKLLDFGLARILYEASQGEALTQVRSFLGTPDYAAPEQASDAQLADIRADVYSLGCSLYHLLAGRAPFADEPLTKKLECHQKATPRSLSDFRDDVPPGLEAVVRKMMAKSVKQRHQTPQEVIEALRPFVEPKAVVEPPRRRGSWRKWLAAAVLFVGAVAAGATYVIKTDKGEVVIEVADGAPEVEVVIRKGGEEVAILDGKTKRQVTLRSGKLSAELKDAPGWEIEAREFVLKRGDKVIVRVRPQGKKKAPKLSPFPVGPERLEGTFSGRGRQRGQK